MAVGGILDVERWLLDRERGGWKKRPAVGQASVASAHPGRGILAIERWLLGRERGGWKKRPAVGQASVASVLPSLFSSIHTTCAWNPSDTIKHTNHGGIFNFDFSSDGSLLVAACERKSVLMFDPLNGKLINAKSHAHDDCVNCVRFLDNRMFVTCSDDTTVCLWDSRFLNHKVRTLRGHSNWVKNIEYDSNTNLLVTSGFDGSIYAWDINSYTSDPDISYKRLFHTNGLMRSKLTPDGSRLIIATAGGYLMVVHNLDLQNLQQDLHGFKPNMYRLMQKSQSPIRHGYLFNHVFDRHRNRIELISDFPKENEAEMIASLEVHPQGWCVVSRNTSSDESSEWTCVHDIQTSENENEDDASNTSGHSSPAQHETEIGGSEETEEAREEEVEAEGYLLELESPNSPSSTSELPVVMSLDRNNASRPTPAVFPSVSQSDDESDDEIQPQWQGGGSSRRGEENIDEVLRPPSGLQAELVSRSALGNTQGSALGPHVRVGESMTFIIRSTSEIHERTLLVLGQHPEPTPVTPGVPAPKIHSNRPRLSHYIEEPNVGRGFIKEVCFSSDGRLVCSPFGHGVRLLAFDPACNELCDTLYAPPPRQLREVTTNMGHPNVVVTTKFSPTHCLLVSGCLNGKVEFHQPRL